MKSSLFTAVIAMVFASAGAAPASMPTQFQTFEGCVVDGFLYRADRSGMLLKLVNDPNWSDYDGMVVRLRRTWDRGVNRLTAPPTVLGVCAAGEVQLARARAAAARGLQVLMRGNQREAGAATVEAAAPAEPDDCEILADLVYARETVGRGKDAENAAVHARAHQCAPERYDRQLLELRHRHIPQMY